LAFVLVQCRDGCFVDDSVVFQVKSFSDDNTEDWRCDCGAAEDAGREQPGTVGQVFPIVGGVVGNVHGSSYDILVVDLDGIFNELDSGSVVDVDSFIILLERDLEEAASSRDGFGWCED
jgi:hypothetical protein